MYANPAKLMKLDTYIMHWVAVYLEKVGIVNRLFVFHVRLTSPFTHSRYVLRFLDTIHSLFKRKSARAFEPPTLGVVGGE